MLSDMQEIAGHGTISRYQGRELLVGNAALLSDNGVEMYKITDDIKKLAGTVVLVALDGVYRGALVISDSVKEGAAEAVAGMRRAGVHRVVMLTGDREDAARTVCESLSLDAYYAELLPVDKVDAVEKLIADNAGSGKLAFVGDGINDAPVLMRADVGIAMGSLGSDAAIEAADIVVMDDDLRRLDKAVAIGRKTQAIVRQNIVFSLAVKLLVLILSAFGLTSMWVAAFADVGVMILAVLNAMRTLRT
jgi:Cd2+/Zn2+-exporting ATPase